MGFLCITLIFVGSCVKVASGILICEPTIEKAPSLQVSHGTRLSEFQNATILQVFPPILSAFPWILYADGAWGRINLTWYFYCIE